MSPLEQATQRLEFQVDALTVARSAFKLKDALKKYIQHKIIRDAPGNSIAEKTMNGYSTEEWMEFSLELARLEDKYAQEYLKYGVLKADYQTKYLLHKESEEQIRKYR